MSKKGLSVGFQQDFQKTGIFLLDELDFFQKIWILGLKMGGLGSGNLALKPLKSRLLGLTTGKNESLKKNVKKKLTKPLEGNKLQALTLFYT